MRRLAVGGLAGGVLYAYDELVNFQVIQRSIRALFCGAAVFVDYKFIWTPENASDVHLRVARRIVDTCKANEGLFVKFGQLMGSMQVALPQEYMGPLGELHDQAKTFDTRTVRSILAEELPSHLAEALEELTPLPVASASVAQVHTATLNGKKVAVKIQKPNIRAQNKIDLLVYRFLLSVLEYSFEIPLVWTFDFVKKQLESELDFTVEAKNAKQCRNDFALNRKLNHIAYVPETMFATKRVIITEWIEGAIKINDTAQLEELGIDSRAVVQHATELFAYQIFGTGNVHCDPHPGNLLVRVKRDDGPSSAVGSAIKCITSFFSPRRATPHEIVLIDHGLYVHLNNELKRDYVDFWVAMMTDDEAKLVSQCQKWGIHDSELFSSMTLMRRRDKKLKEGVSTPTVPITSAHIGLDNKDYENEEGQNKMREELELKLENERKEAARRAAAVERQRQLKERVKMLLNDTSKFPDELGFVGRSVNYIRATNWAHGSPIDRVAIFANAAVRASVGDEGRIGEWSWRSPAAVAWLYGSIALRLWAPSIYYGDRIRELASCTIWR